jgi:hypothetical protein
MSLGFNLAGPNILAKLLAEKIKPDLIIAFSGIRTHNR